MLKDEIEERKKRNPGGMGTRTGACRFCGQIATLEIPVEWTDEQVDEAAVECCTCAEADIYTLKKRRKAAKAIEEQFGEESETSVDESIKDILKAVADQIVEHKIRNGTIDMGNGLKSQDQNDIKRHGKSREGQNREDDSGGIR